MKKSRIAGCLVMLAALCSAACGSLPRSEVGAERIVERSGKRPDWIGKECMKSADKLYAVGVAEQAAAEQDGRTDSRMHAIGELADTISISINQAWVEARDSSGLSKDDPDAERTHRSVLALSTKDVLLSKTRTSAVYWVKYEKKTDSGLAHLYKVYSLVEIPRRDIEIAYLQKIEDAKATAGNNASFGRLLDAASRTKAKLFESLPAASRIGD